jgi:hypothetical protein
MSLGDVVTVYVDRAAADVYSAMVLQEVHALAATASVKAQSRALRTCDLTGGRR